jgi:DNA-binding beta-propeller fold protein YncE
MAGPTSTLRVLIQRDNTFIRQFGIWIILGKGGNGDGELNFPTGISIDSDDTVYIAEKVRNHRVSVFTKDGKFLISFGSQGDGPGQFN